MGSITDTEIIIEALLFASGDPVSLDKISEIIGHDKKTTRVILSNLIYKYQNASRGIMVRQIDDGYQLCTKPELDEFIQKLGTVRKRQGLTPAAYEALSIIAYNQPVTRSYIEQIRGVNSDSVLQTLVERNLIREAGRDDSPGKPKLYETTEEFLRVFGFSSVKDLPPLEMNEIPEILENVPLD
ncbi:MAG: SMC-Scp complex subunit ScpB [Clostridiaceae bacterium]|jgi:segregation and condensation protein B|nr:SMC-Scp complex subunit ScpB [Clostridiaceae bacterium]